MQRLAELQAVRHLCEGVEITERLIVQIRPDVLSLVLKAIAGIAAKSRISLEKFVKGNNCDLSSNLENSDVR